MRTLPNSMKQIRRALRSAGFRDNGEHTYPGDADWPPNTKVVVLGRRGTRPGHVDGALLFPDKHKPCKLYEWAILDDGGVYDREVVGSGYADDLDKLTAIIEDLRIKRKKTLH